MDAGEDLGGDRKRMSSDERSEHRLAKGQKILRKRRGSIRSFAAKREGCIPEVVDQLI